MDSKLAADPIARHILEQFAILARVAGIRSHYKIMEPPPLLSTDMGSLQTAARVIADGIGMRNAMFHIAEGGGTHIPSLMRTDRDQDEFTMELPKESLTSVSSVLAAMARQIARAYLINFNIAGSSVMSDDTTGSTADITAVFLGLGGMMLNDPDVGGVPSTKQNAKSFDQPLEGKYLAFAHRAVCSMRGLDWQQNVVGFNNKAMTLLREWDSYRDTVFSISLRNVLTASVSHRPLQDSVDDNLFALARLDQFQRVFYAGFIEPIQKQVNRFHNETLNAVNQLKEKESDTYDPCMLYLNQVRRRMNLQRYADELHVQQNLIFDQLEILAAAYHDLKKRDLISGSLADNDILQATVCPFDGALVLLKPNQKDQKVRCTTCGYQFLASSGVPTIPVPVEKSKGSGGSQLKAGDAAASANIDSGESADVSEVGGKKKSKSGMPVVIAGFLILPVVWGCFIAYALYCGFKGKAPDQNMVDMLGTIGLIGTGIGLVAMIVGLTIFFVHRTNRGK